MLAIRLAGWSPYTAASNRYILNEDALEFTHLPPLLLLLMLRLFFSFSLISAIKSNEGYTLNVCMSNFGRIHGHWHEHWHEHGHLNAILDNNMIRFNIRILLTLTSFP